MKFVYILDFVVSEAYRSSGYGLLATMRTMEGIQDVCGGVIL